LRDRTPPAWDPADHLRYGYDYYRLMAHADFAGFAREFFITRHYYPPFVHLVSAAVFLVSGASRLTGIGANLLSLVALLWAVSSLSGYLYANPESTEAKVNSASRHALVVLPALLAACYHFSAWLLHDAFLDFPLTAIVAVAFALLVRADDFRVRRDAIAFGIAAGVGLLVKQTFAFFFLLPAVYVVIRVVRTRDRRAILNLAMTVAVLILVAGIWYGPHFADVIAIYRENQRAAVNENEAPLFTFDSNFFYVHALISMQMQLPLAVVFVAGLIYSLVRCRKQSVMLYLWLVSGLACFALVANKDVRYTAPVLPAAALLSACWLREFITLKPKTQAGVALGVLKTSLIVAITVWALVSFFNAQWPKPGWGTAIDTPRYRWMVFSRNYYGFDHRPLNDDWSLPKIVNTVSSLPRGDGLVSTDTIVLHSLAAGESPPILGVVVNLAYLNPSSVALYSRFMAPGRAGPPMIDVRWIVEPTMIDRIDGCDYILVRTGLDKADWVASVERDTEKLIRANPDRFTLVASFPIPLAEADAVVYRLEQR